MNESELYGAWSETERQHYRQQGYWTNVPLGEQLRLWARQQPNRIALVSGQQRLRYDELDTLADRLAAGFNARGIQAGDNVLLQLPNCTGLVAALFALFRLGARPILAMPAQKGADIDALCTLAQPKAWVYPAHYLGHDFHAIAQQMSVNHPTIQRWLVNTADDSDTPLAEFQLPAQRFSVPHAEDIALLLLSGGSTGTPKLIPRTHADYFYNARTLAGLCQLTGESVYLATLAVAHNFTLSCPGVLGTLLSGGKVVLAQTASCDEIFPLIEQERVTFTALVPPLMNLWLECREWDESDLSSLQFIQVGGARLESTLAEKVKPAFGCQLQQVFGMAEGLICCTRLDDSDEVILHTQGRPISDADQIRVVNAGGAAVAEGEPGELLTRGPYTIGGYYRAEAQNLLAFTPDRFYRSGDIIRLTEGGNVIVEGRIKEQINRAGEKIGCTEIESLMALHPSVVSAIVVGVSDERLGERICACYQGEATLKLGELRTFLLQKGLSNYKLPDQLLHIASWPLTAVGKIDKRRLATLAQQAQEKAHSSRAISLRHPPLDVLYHLMQEEHESHIAYERQGCWHVGIGIKAQIRLFTDYAELISSDGQRQTFQNAPWRENLQSALDALPFSHWQIFGVSHFELARLIYDVSAADLDKTSPLMTLIVPQVQIALSEQSAMLITTSEEDLERLTARIQQADRSVNFPAPDNEWQDAIASTIRQHDAHAYCHRVAETVHEIKQGLYQKVILSRQVMLTEPVDMLASYHLGRTNNTPARSYIVKIDDHHFIGFSPETVVEVSASGTVSTQPLAGTRALTADAQQNQQLREALISDTKEVAEHAVSVKLAVEELLPVCVANSTHVSDFMSIAQRGSVQHLASRVTGKLSEEFSAWDAFAMLFPAVTASGIPKRPAIEAITRLEPVKRSAYSGSVFMFNSGGELDAALVLRSLFKNDNGVTLQAGAGIIDQSTPKRELEETVEKLQSVSRFLVKAQR